MTTETDRQLLELARVPPGSYKANTHRPWWHLWKPSERGGWLTVERDMDGCTSVMWTTDRDSHQRHSRWGCARSISLKPDGTLVAYFESALSMWIKWGHGRGSEIELRRAMEFAAWAHRHLRCSAIGKAMP